MMLTITVEEYIYWRAIQYYQNPDYWYMSLAYMKWRHKPHWEPTPEVERMMRMKPEGGGVLYATK